MKLKEKKLSSVVSTILLVLALISLLGVNGIKNLVGEDVEKALIIMGVVILACFFFTFAKDIKVDLLSVLFIVYQLIILFSTLFSGEFTYGIGISILSFILIFLLVQSNLYGQIITILSILVFVVSLINLPFVFIDGLKATDSFFIGGKNALNIFLLPAMFIMLLKGFEKKSKYTVIAIIGVVVSLITMFIASGATGKVVALASVVLLLLIIKIRPAKWIFIGVIVAVYILLVSGILVETQIWQQIADKLGKNANLTYRTDVWESVRVMVAEKPLFGYGRVNEISYVTDWGGTVILNEAHNFALEIALEGGIISVIIYLFMLFRGVAGLNLKLLSHKIIFVAFCLVLINGLTESINNKFLVVVIFAIVCRFCNEEKDRKKLELERIEGQKENEG
ncbi:MAG: O-antigen ligase family protein [Clostridia bacterium]|nr:O-antigen ligase family protein [Clostridia bacterium]